MTEDIHRLLLEADETGCYEFPSSFNYEALEAPALRVNEAIGRSLREATEFEGAASNQDASFSIAILLTDHRRSDGAQPGIRFSNFGSLATITWPELLPAGLDLKIVEILYAEGFNFIPSEVLDEPYDGTMEGDPVIPTWWIRYFDWI